MKLADPPQTGVDLHVAASPERVWEVVTDITLPARFSEELQRVEWLDGATGPALGATFAGHNRNAFLGSWRTVCHVVEFEPQRVFAWAVTDPDTGDADPARPLALWRFVLEPDGAGVRVSQSVRIGPARSALHIAIERRPDKEEAIIARRLADLRAGMGATLDGIKALAEATP